MILDATASGIRSSLLYVECRMPVRRRKRDTRFSARRQPDRYAGAANRKGSDNFASKLTEKDVVKARQMHKRGTPLHELADKFGVHASTMSRALRRLTFKHVR
jgi:hypothetical protein